MMMFRIILICTFVLFVSTVSFAQSSSRDNSRKRSPLYQERGSTFQAEGRGSVRDEKNYKDLSKDFDRKVQEYYVRMEQAAKRNAKIAKEMQKPQYSDPTYFGHKKKPKKNPPGKKKFCKECEMYH